jgi:hypothetical protein
VLFTMKTVMLSVVFFAANCGRSSISEHSFGGSDSATTTTTVTTTTVPSPICPAAELPKQDDTVGHQERNFTAFCPEDHTIKFTCADVDGAAGTAHRTNGTQKDSNSWTLGFNDEAFVGAGGGSENSRTGKVGIVCKDIAASENGKGRNRDAVVWRKTDVVTEVDTDVSTATHQKVIITTEKVIGPAAPQPAVTSETEGPVETSSSSDHTVHPAVKSGVFKCCNIHYPNDEDDRHALSIQEYHGDGTRTKCNGRELHYECVPPAAASQ